MLFGRPVPYDLSSNSERIPPLTAGVNRVRSGPQPTGDGRTGTLTFSIARGDSSHTGSADSQRLVATEVGPSTTHGDGAPRARSKGVTGAGTGAARHDLWGESLPLKPAGDDIPRDGSPRGRATGRSRARVETRPTDLGRASPETDRQPAGFPLCREAASFTARRMSHIPLHSFNPACARVAKPGNGGGLKIRSRRGPRVQIPSLASLWVPPRTHEMRKSVRKRPTADVGARRRLRRVFPRKFSPPMTQTR